MHELNSSKSGIPTTNEARLIAFSALMKHSAFFNFDEFGSHIAEEYAGQFTSCGFIYYSGTNMVDQILNALEDEDSAMTMGGM